MKRHDTLSTFQFHEMFPTEEVVDKTDAKTLKGFVETRTTKDVAVYTDDSSAYEGIGRDHETVCHSADTMAHSTT